MDDEEHTNVVRRRGRYGQDTRIIAHGRPVTEACERGSVGCAINHTAEGKTQTCETW